MFQQLANKVDNAVKLDEFYMALSSVPVFNENGMQWRRNNTIDKESANEKNQLTLFIFT